MGDRRAPALAVLFLAAAASAAGADRTLTITRQYTPADRERERYVYVPFDVPAGTAELRLRYAYDDAGDRNTIDFGLFEPGSLELGAGTLRGYSGGSTREVTVGEHDATPGYRAGPLPSGRWHAMLGLYRVAEGGVSVTLTVELVAAPASPRWWAGALHVHTRHSDGAAAAPDVLRRAHAAGLDFVAITDHNNATHADELRQVRRAGDAPLWIAGEEVTTPAGHASVWGLGPGEWVDFRVRPPDGRIGALVEAAHRHGALFSINHPTSACAGCDWRHEVPEAIDAVEVWNGRHGAQDTAVAFWERLIAAGRRVTAVGSSDWHRDPDPIDGAHVRVYAPALTESAILDGVRAGRVIVMRSARDATPAFTIRTAGVVGSIGDAVAASPLASTIEVLAPGQEGGRAVVVANGARLPPLALDGTGAARLTRVLAPGSVRVEIFDRDGALVAMTNPVYLTGTR